MTTEVYKDQFRPWTPNHWGGDGGISADTLGGAIIGHMIRQDAQGLTDTANFIYATITTNFHLRRWAALSIKPEAQ